ncbi:hypothetical protein [Enterococcus faecalis]|uniref:hypothetical protein n=1 Tax=Enterococcus faecalis TaxID=1351 RepID=UPI0003533D5E|nr:hypothetical protein [Enterococcus faecalis]EPI39277.1 hypothetical protein D347_01395 [Enterococcus faecalis LA3B-2]
MKKIGICAVFEASSVLFATQTFAESQEQELANISDQVSTVLDTDEVEIIQVSKGGQRATQIIECKKYGQCQGPWTQLYHRIFG